MQHHLIWNLCSKVVCMTQGKRVALSAAQRTELWSRWKAGESLHTIGRAFGKPHNSIHGFLSQRGGIVPPVRRRSLLVLTAVERAWDSALRPKRCLLAIHVKLRKIVASKLILDWSPEQISGWLKIQYPADESMRVSHETIYRSLFIQARGVLKKELLGHLRSKRRIRRSQHSRIFKDARGQIVDAISIRERPAEIEDRA